MQSTKLLGVRIDKVELTEATRLIENWLKEKPGSPKLIVTPNLEFIIDAQTDERFKKILNDADLSIPDSSRLGWLENQLNEKSKLKRLLNLLISPLTGKLINPGFPILAGVDLMEALCKFASQNNYSVGLIGGKDDVAEKTAEALKKRYPNLMITFVDSGGEIDREGNVLRSKYYVLREKDNNAAPQNPKYEIPNTDILFVGFGHKKQEKWIVNYQDQVKAKVLMGVGGSFDYISGSVPRAPKPVRNLGLEWLYRLVMQPWRITRQIRIFKFGLDLIFR